MNKIEIGQYLSKIRKQKGISIYSIDLLSIGITRNQITSIEKATANYSIETLLLYCKILGVKLDFK